VTITGKDSLSPAVGGVVKMGTGSGPSESGQITGGGGDEVVVALGVGGGSDADDDSDTTDTVDEAKEDVVDIEGATGGTTPCVDIAVVGGKVRGADSDGGGGVDSGEDENDVRDANDEKEKVSVTIFVVVAGIPADGKSVGGIAKVVALELSRVTIDSGAVTTVCGRAVVLRLVVSLFAGGKG
jgi:hypothetical protein